MRELLAIDGSSLLHRAWHSTRQGEDADREGTVTAAFASMVATVWTMGPYAALLVALDHPVNHRRRDFPEYKANRGPTPAGLRAAIDAAEGHLLTAGVAVRRTEGIEADDLLAAAADDARQRGISCDLLSSDRDLLASVGGPVRLLRPRQRFADLVVEDEEHVRREHGVAPHQYVDLAALRGDPSDGLAGAPGIGPARAARLVRDHGNIAGIYAALPDLPPAIARGLRDGRDDVERNLLLMSPAPHLDVALDEVLGRGAPLDALAELVEGLGFPGAARRVRRARTPGGRAEVMPPAPPPHLDRDVPDDR